MFQIGLYLCHNGYIMKSEVFKTAWQFFKENLFNSFSECLKAAWQRIKLVTRLRAGLAYFSFRKTNGETREAIGTLNTTNYNYQPKSNGQRRKSSLMVVKFWDIEKRAFRSLRIDRFICFN